MAQVQPYCSFDRTFDRVRMPPPYFKLPNMVAPFHVNVCPITYCHFRLPFTSQSLLLSPFLDATLLRKVFVKSDGQMSVTIATSNLKHDVTGGVREKLQTASNIIRISKEHTRVFVLNILSEAVAYSVCNLGVLEGNGTEILAEIHDSGDV